MICDACKQRFVPEKRAVIARMAEVPRIDSDSIAGFDNAYGHTASLYKVVAALGRFIDDPEITALLNSKFPDLITMEFR